MFIRTNAFIDYAQVTAGLVCPVGVTCTPWESAS
jgi:hypothetical protein